MLGKIQGNIKESSKSIFLILLKVGAGCILGLTVALVVKGFITLASFAFIFVIVATAGAFMRLSSRWKFQGVLLFSLFCVMTAMLLRMYILLAPGS